MKRIVARGLAVLLVALVAAGLGFVIWANDTNPVGQPALDALQTDAAVSVEQGRWIVFRPAAAAPQAGFIFYPGGRVDPRAYAAHVRAIAAQGSLAVIVPMPLNLAVTGINRADDVIAAFPEIDTWAIGGHSLGAAMAASYAYNHPEVVDGLVLWAGYPAESSSLAGSDLPVLSIYGERDGLATPEKVEAFRPYLPQDTQYVMVEGGNHAGFGWYGAQRGDGAAVISTAEQQAFVSEQTAAFLTALR